ncbi:DMT family transporter [Peribacillus cavernae]|uniref:DMT family transporter n=1 Tax=Peribacillus cavernae TaxID=1674310 RepID=UPI001FE616D5|nr:DMT family transporter [Peribacillus cavernae]MDQ0220998.1 drug/metabolite transporter (DMT)-like permease [Peribacillus cavernae]
MKKQYVLLFLILANLFWAGNYVFGKYVVAEMTPLQMTFFRWLIAVFLLFPIAHWIERPNWKEVWKEWKILLVMSILGIIAYNYLLYEALRFTTSLNAALVNSINPAFIVLFSAILLKEKIPLKNGVGLIISLLGVLLVLTKGQLQQIFQLDYNQGDVFMLLAILVWTFYSIIGKKLKTIPPISATAASVLLALVILFPFMMVSGFNPPLSQQAVLGILYIGIFPSVGSFIFWNVSLRHMGASRAGIYLNLIAVFTAILSLVLGKSITFVQIIGGILVFIGVYLTSQKEKNRENPVRKKGKR